jgi:hypothetical protein
MEVTKAHRKRSDTFGVRLPEKHIQPAPSIRGLIVTLCNSDFVLKRGFICLAWLQNDSSVLLLLSLDSWILPNESKPPWGLVAQRNRLSGNGQGWRKGNS